jgi:putative endonuclease
LWGQLLKWVNARHPELVEGSDTRALWDIVKEFYVYILTNTAGVLYVGVTSDLEGRFWEHTEERLSKFTARYNLDRLLFYESYPSAQEAITREKQLKGWRREKKLWLIASMNPSWRDLSGRLRI